MFSVSPAPLSHQPVLLDEALAALNIRADGHYVDATFGRGGHSAALLAALLAGDNMSIFAAHWFLPLYYNEGLQQYRRSTGNR